MNSANTIPEWFPAQLFDGVAAFADRWVDMMFNLELVFDDRLDAQRIARAVDLSLDAEPILGCRFVPHWWKPYWKRLDRKELQTFQLVKDENEYLDFRIKSIDTYSEPQLKACLWQASDGDHLILKISHIVCDAGGAKDVARIVSTIYSCLNGELDYIPQPNTKGSRGIAQIMRNVPWRKYPHLLLNYRRMNRAGNIPPGTHVLPFQTGPSDQLTFVVRHISKDRVAELAKYGQRYDGTLNDIMLAAFFRALAFVGEWDGKKQLRVDTTVDLRRYIPNGRAEAVTFLTSAYNGWPSLGTDLGYDYASTLNKVVAITKKAKADYLGLDNLLLAWLFIRPPYARVKWMLEYDDKRRFKKGNTANALTNMGSIDPESVTFGVVPVSAWMLVPPAYAPYFAMGMTGYEGTLTLSAGVYPPNVEITEQFFHAVIAELPI
jgi:NRPS condensation-like uncharacterized protein